VIAGLRNEVAVYTRGKARVDCSREGEYDKAIDDVSGDNTRRLASARLRSRKKKECKKHVATHESIRREASIMR
jgi:hypothetical protein